MTEPTYEYRIVYKQFPGETHRGPFDKVTAEQWMQEWLEMGAVADAMWIERRPVGSWEPV